MFSKAAIKRFNEEQTCAPPPTKYDPKLGGNTKAVAFEGYSSRNDAKSDCDEREFRTPCAPSTIERGRKRAINTTGSNRKARAENSSSSRSRSASAKVVPKSNCLGTTFGMGSQYLSAEDLLDAESEISELRGTLETIERDRYNLETQLLALQGSFEDTTKEYNLLKTQVSMDQGKIAELEQSLDDERKKLANLQGNFETINSQLEDTQKRIKKEEDTSNKLREDLEISRQEKLESEHQWRKLHQDALTDLIKNHQQALETEKAEAQLREAAYKAELQTLSETKIQEIEQITDRIVKLEDELEEAQVNVRTSADGIEGLKAHISVENHRTSELQQKLEDETKTLSSMQVNYETICSQLEDTQKRIREEEDISNKLREDLEIIRQEKLESVYELERLHQDALTDLIKNHQQVLDTEKAEAEIKEAAYKAELERLSETKDKEIEQITDRILKMNKELEEGQENIRTSADEIETLKTQISELQKKLEEETTALNRMQVNYETTNSELEDSQKRIKEKEDTSNKLREDLEIIRQEKLESEQELRKLHQDALTDLIKNHQQVLEVVKADSGLTEAAYKAELQKLSETKNKEIEQITDRILKMEDELEEAHVNVTTSADEIEGLKAQFKELQQKLEEETKTLSSMQVNYETICSQLEDTQKRLRDEEDTSNKLREDLENIRQEKLESQESEQELRKFHQDAITDLIKNHQQVLETEKAEAELREAAYKVELKTLSETKNKEIQQITDRIVKMEEELEEAQENVRTSADEIETLEAQISELQQKLEEKTTALNRMQVNYETVYSQLEDTQKRIKEKEDTSNKLREDLEILRQEKLESEHELKKLHQDALNDLIKNHQQVLETQKGDAELREAAYNSELKTLSETKNKEIEQITDRIVKMEEELNEAQVNVITSADEIETLKAQISVENHRTNELEHTLDEERKKLANYQANYETINSQLEDTQNRVRDEEDISNKLREELEISRKEKLESEQELRKLQQDAITDLIKNHQQVIETEKAEAELREAAYKAELERLSEIKNKEIEQITERIVKLEDELEEAQVNVITSADEIETLKAQISVENHRTNELEQKLDEERKKLANLQVNFETINSQLEDTQNRVRDEEDISNKLRKDLEILRQEKLESEQELKKLHQDALTDLKKNHQQVLEVVKADAVLTEAAYKAELQKLSETKTQEIEEINVRIVKLEDELEEAQVNVRTSAAEIEALKAHISVENHRTSELQQKLEEETKTLNSMQVNYETICLQLEDTQKRIREEKDISNKLREDLEIIRQEKLESVYELERLHQDALTDLIKNHQQVLDTEKAEAEIKEAAYKAELERLSETKNKEIENITDRIVKVEEELKEAEENVRTSTDEIVALKSQISVENHRTRELEKTLDEERKKLANFQVNFETIYSQLEDTQKRIREEEGISEKLRETNKSIAKKIEEEVTAKFACSVEDAKKLQMRCRAYEKRMMELEAQGKEINEKYAKLMGHSNHRQKIHHVVQLKEENEALKLELFKLRKKELERSSHEQSQARGKFDRSQAFKHPLKEVDQPFIPETGDLRGSESRQTFVVSKSKHGPAKAITRIRDEVRSEQGLAFSIDFEDNKEN